METSQAGPSSKMQTDDQINTTFIEGIKNTYQYLNVDYLCSLCCQLFHNPHLTKCGHTFCHTCIVVHLRTTKKCPKCTANIKNNNMVPNVLMKKLVYKYRKNNKSLNNGVNIDKHRENSSSSFSLLTQRSSQNVTAPRTIGEILTKANTLSTVNNAIRILKVRKNSAEINQYIHVTAHLYHFVKYFIREHEMKFYHLRNLLQVLRSDYEQTKCDSTDAQTEKFQTRVDGTDACMAHYKKMITDDQKSILDIKRKIYIKNFVNFRQCYFDTRVAAINFGVKPSTPCAFKDTAFHGDFGKCLRYQSIKLVGTLNYSPDIFNTSNIVSGVEFDKDEEFLAVSGVIQEVKIYRYDTIINDVVDIHYPSTHWSSISKVSSLSWNPFHKNMLAWSDYDGAVAFWDVATGESPKLRYEHEKRCWSVDFNNVDPKLLASGSDDGRLKIWSIDVQKSVSTLQTNSNICCVKFNPYCPFDIAFGSADHNIYYYDLRRPTEPLRVLREHRKTVSYIKFTDGNTIVSASTDSQLKVWDIEKLSCVRTLVGHRNEKNFVGLATDGDYVASGSENNSLYIYYKTMEKPVFVHTFGTEKGILNEYPDEQYSHEFISAVCWRKRSNCVVAANSQGIVNIIELCDETQ